MNSEENIVKMPDPLERLATRILAALARDPKLHAEWVEIQLEKADALFQAKKQFPHTMKFSEWCSANGFGEEIISRNVRAALIQFGEDLPRARALMKKYYANWSVEVLFNKHWRVQNALNSLKSRSEIGRKVKAALVDAQAYREEHNKLPTERDMNDRGHSDGSASAAKAALKIAEEVRAEEALKRDRAVADALAAKAAETVKYTKAQDHHVATRIRAAIKELEKAAQAREASFWERVTQEANASCAKRFPNLQERENDVVRAERHWRNVANNHQPILNETEFAIIRFCLHPDNSASKEKRENAFSIFNLKKLQLTGKK